MGKQSRRRQPASTPLDEKINSVQEKITRDARARAVQMAPADQHMDACNRSKATERAKAVLSELAPDSVMRPAFSSIVENGGRAFLYDIVVGDEIRLATVGLGLVGKSELHLSWPLTYKREAFAIIEDLVDKAYHGRMDPDEPHHGKCVLALAYDVAYVVRAVTDPLQEFGRGQVSAATKAYRGNGVPVAFRLVFSAGLREGVELPGGVPGTRWDTQNKKDGTRNVRTGLVEFPIPSRSWAVTPFQGSKARLVDPNGPVDGPHVIVKPGVYLLLMERDGFVVA